MRVLFVAAAAVGSLRSVASAQMFTDWTAGSSDWDTATNWSNGEPLTPGEVASISNFDATNRTITYDYSGEPDWGAVNVNNADGGTNTLSMTTSGLTLAATEYVGGYNTIGLSFTGVDAAAILRPARITSSARSMLATPRLPPARTSSTAPALSTGGTEYVGNQAGSGAFIQTGGTNTITGYDSQLVSLYLGNLSGFAGSYSRPQRGAKSVLNSEAVETIGNTGAGFFTQTDGTNMAGDSIVLGGGGDIGASTMSGNGSPTYRPNMNQSVETARCIYPEQQLAQLDVELGTWIQRR